MSDNDDPPGWAVDPAFREQLRRLRENSWTSGKETMFNLQDAIKNIAADLTTAEPAPGFWAEWVTYLLEQLQERAEEANQMGEFEAMLQALEKDLAARIQSGHW